MHTVDMQIEKNYTHI